MFNYFNIVINYNIEVPKYVIAEVQAPQAPTGSEMFSWGI
jgi:hypothetical protein